MARPLSAVEPGQDPTTYRVRYPLPGSAPKVSLVIPTRDHAAMLRKCVGSILARTEYPNFEVLIVDNQSREDETRQCFEELARDPRVRIAAYDAPFNFSAINNFAVRQVDGELVGLVNNDIEVIAPGWLGEMASHALRPEIGAVGAKLYYGNDTVQHAGIILGIGGVAGHSHKYFRRSRNGYFGRLRLVQNVSAVTAACLVIRRATYEAAGGMDEANLRIAFNDVDFCLKVRALGLRNLWTPYAELYHHESVTRGSEDSPEKRERFRREVETMRSRWGAQLTSDPCYSPMLSLITEDFSQDYMRAALRPWEHAPTPEALPA